MNLIKLFLLACLFVSTTASADELSPWTLKLSSGEGVKNYSLSRTMSLSELTQTIYPVDNYKVKTSTINKNKKVKVTYIGQLSSINVYDLIYPLENNEYLKAIFLEKQPNQYIPVYYCFVDERYGNHSLETINASFIIADKHLVVSQLPMTGNGGYLDNFYLYVPPNILESKNSAPKIIDESIIYDTLKQKLPKDYYAPASNAFNIKTLHFHSCVTKTTAHCFNENQADVVDMQFKLENGNLKLVSFVYKCC